MHSALIRLPFPWRGEGLGERGIRGCLFSAACLIGVVAAVSTSHPAAASPTPFLIGVSELAAALPPIPANPDIVFHAPTLSGTLTNSELIGTLDDPATLVYGGEFSVAAQKLYYDRLTGAVSGSGSPIIRELNAHLTADSFEFEPGAGLAQATGSATDAVLDRPPYIVRAKLIRLTSGDIVGDDASFTTAPPNVRPVYSIRARTVTIYPDTGILDIRSGDFYLFGTHLLRIKHYQLDYGAPGEQKTRRKLTRPIVSVSPEYGLFGSYDAPAGTWLPIEVYLLLPQRTSPQVRLTAVQPIKAKHHPSTPNQVFLVGDPGHIQPGSITAPNGDTTDAETPSRAPATVVKQGTGISSTEKSPLAEIRSFVVGNGPLPEGDPLLFYQFVPWPVSIKPLEPHGGPGLATVEQVSANIESSGNQQNFLFVSRLPELGLTANLPLSPVTKRPDGDDPNVFRSYLRRPILYAGASTIFGHYDERPTDISADRWQDNAWLTTSPFLVAKNTVILPRLLATFNHYTDIQNGYRYAQGSLSLMHYITDRTAFGFDYSLSAVSGSSPFNFDVLDAAQELDLRGQIGNRNLAVGGVIRDDLDHGHVFDYRVTVAPTVGGIIPVFTYDFQTKATGVGLALEGITF